MENARLRETYIDDFGGKRFEKLEPALATETGLYRTCPMVSGG